MRLVSGKSEYVIPSYSEIHAVVRRGYKKGTEVVLQPVRWSELPSIKHFHQTPGPPVCYYINDRRIQFYPTPDRAYFVRVQYMSKPVKAVAREY